MDSEINPLTVGYLLELYFEESAFNGFPHRVSSNETLVHKKPLDESKGLIFTLLSVETPCLNKEFLGT